ncbi:selenium metabolism-associated LysR family transcriptional regulator [Desulfofalx alkaliphila]|uniref:selenium metabolism-associated LysR family transcriptional regulator n=1 Tax=Desulfofalx alkaliphila TaxID=105483 RepID=UPI0004E1A829|nr:selenium metabolism-associated LysR family transcriptional regulator [Desulfofalx alkaliphila]
MNTALLRTFITVVNKKSLSLAAQEIHITQPAVSKQINALEDYFGIGLIERRGRGITLTPAGEVLYRNAIEILDLINKTEREIRDLSETVKGKLVIWASSIPGHFILPYVIGAFQKHYPEVHISLHISDSKDVLRHLLDESAQLGAVGTKPENKKLEYCKFLDDQLVVITPKDHPLANKGVVNLQQLAGERLVWRSIGSGTRLELEEKLSEAGLPREDLNIVMELGSTGAVVNAVEAGLGISIVSRWAIKKEETLGRISVLEIEGLNLNRELYLVYPRRRHKNRVVQVFLEFVRSDNYSLPQ